VTLPPNEPDGYLPIGVHSATLSEIEARFAVTQDRRELMALLRAVTALLATIPEVKRLIIDGCFIGPREPTNDVDIVAMIEPPPDKDTDRELSRRMKTVRKGYAPRISLLWFIEGSANSRIIVQWLQRDKLEHGGTLKGIIELEGFR
jgi:hypothetical protein